MAGGPLAIRIDNFEAEVDLSARQYTAVIIGTAAHQVTTPGGAGARAVGILQNKPKAGEQAQVLTLGRTLAKAKAAYAKDALLRVNGTDGKLEGITVGVTNATIIIGFADGEAAGAEDELRHIDFFGPKYAATT